MPRYLIERTFQEHFGIPGQQDSDQVRMRFIENNTLHDVVWVQSYVSPDRKKSYCIYEAPAPEALRRAALENHLPVDRIVEVDALEPFLVE